LAPFFKKNGSTHAHAQDASLALSAMPRPFPHQIIPSCFYLNGLEFVQVIIVSSFEDFQHVRWPLLVDGSAHHAKRDPDSLTDKL
jgi:hypothetical protein